MRTRGWTCVSVLAGLLAGGTTVQAETRYVAAGANLQNVLNEAGPGDTILLEEGAEFVGNFVLPVKSGDGWITVRTSAPDTVLPPAGVRILPSHASLLARLRSANTAPALRTAAGAHHWDIRYLEFGPNANGYGDIIQIGDGSSAQNTIEEVPHHIVLDHVYVHGDPAFGQKRGIALNAADVTISDSYVSECKAVGQDAQALGGWNGPGPYVIENNYFEGAGENVLFGGADPAIPNLVPDGITFRRNYVSRPMSWRDPIIGTPQAASATAEAGGSLPAGVYSYRIVARGSVGQGVTGRSSASSEVSVSTVSSASAVRVRWQAVEGATEYRVYGRTSGAQNVYWRVTATEFVDTGLAGAAEKVPTSAGTVWSVKNLFELKNARNVVVEDNLLENHWKESQPGYAIVLTPRNSNGACTWCIVEHVRFENNVVRNVAAGVNLTGYDIPSRPTRQSNDIVFRNNVFQMHTSLGGNGWFMLMGDEPRDVVIEHNTIDSNGTTVLYVYGGTSTDPRESPGFRMVANAARHGNYGVNGSFFSYGNAILANYFPGAVVAANYLAAGPASRYPSGTLFSGIFADQFVNPSAGDYTVRDGSVLKNAAPDGTDIGAGIQQMAERLSGVDTGVMTRLLAPPVASLAVTCTYLECTFSDTSVQGTGAIAVRTWTFGDGDSSLMPSGTHAYAAAGTYSVTLTVADASGLSSTATASVSVEPPNVAPTAAFVPACTDLVCVFQDASTDADGRVASWTWNISGTAVTTQSPSIAFAAPGTYDVSLTVADDDGATTQVSVPVVVTSLLHASQVNGGTTRWDSRWTVGIHYWSAETTIAVHGGDERPIAGATVTATWSGALTRTDTCVTNASGQCTFKSGTLSMLRSWVTLTVAGVNAPLSSYVPAANHGLTANTNGTAVTFTKP